MPLYKWGNVKQVDSAVCGGKGLWSAKGVKDSIPPSHRKAFHLVWKERLCLESYAKSFFYLHRCTLFNISGSFQIQHTVINETNTQSQKNYA